MANIPFMRMGYSLWMRLLEQLDALDALLGGGTAPEACGPPATPPRDPVPVDTPPPRP
jgi:hypothetical protein